jgi:hypothetical protein
MIWEWRPQQSWLRNSWRSFYGTDDIFELGRTSMSCGQVEGVRPNQVMPLSGRR